ncbi:MAG: GNAT family N-acetyltransferase [Ruminococcus sp.]|nr:GNAT family N-acetyltransferase [Ruminococcus sp.]
MSGLTIREVRLSDAARLAEIYSHYVLNTAVSFEYEAPSAAEFESRIAKVTAKFPYLVCEKDGAAVGYAYAGEYLPRKAYSWSAASSIYVHKDFRRQGIGTMLYAELQKRLREMGIVDLVAGSAYTDDEDEYLTHGSYDFHTKMGFSECARFRGIGKKFGRWYDLVRLQKKL